MYTHTYTHWGSWDFLGARMISECLCPSRVTSLTFVPSILTHSDVTWKCESWNLTLDTLTNKHTMLDLRECACLTVSRWCRWRTVPVSFLLHGRKCFSHIFLLCHMSSCSCFFTPPPTPLSPSLFSFKEPIPYRHYLSQACDEGNWGGSCGGGEGLYYTNSEGLWRPHWGLELEWGRDWKRCTP